MRKSPMVWSRYPKKAEPAYPRTYRAVRALAIIVALLAATLAWQHRHSFRPISQTSSAAGERIQVTSVHDGDTFRLGAERIRILGMDAPEIGDGAKCDQEQRAAVAARDYLETALRSDDVHIERHGFDVYGRTLARVYVDGRDIADAMLGEGLARPYVPRRHGDWC